MAQIILFSGERQGETRVSKQERLKNYIREIKERILRNEEINPEEVADRILHIWEIRQPPVPVVEISQALGFKIFEQDYYGDDGTLSGFIAIDNAYMESIGTDRLISLNREDNNGHKRFTISHELCHYIFDFNPYTMLSYSNPYITTEEDDPIEKTANTFAANLLMPKEVFKRESDKLKDQGISFYDMVGKLSEKFAVSSKAIEKRFGEVGET